MGTSNSTRRLSGKQAAGFSSSRQKISPVHEDVAPAYRKPELQDFECVICKDLVFKPVVNACGHAWTCFWCAHESMGAGFQNSSCPMCRSTFSHMPRVCELAHSYLSKVWPREYGARAAEVEEEEKQRNMYSPEPIGLPQSANKRRQVDLAFRSEGVKSRALAMLEGGQSACHAASEIVAAEGAGLAESLQEESSSSETVEAGDSVGEKEFTVHDCECLLCNKLLFQPVVLSCGHAYCFLCLEERFPSGRVVCAYCRKAHLEDEITVCGQLQELVQGAFPQETFQRMRQEAARMGNRKGLLKRVSAQQEQPAGLKGFVHFGIECDACGVYPIVGERYQCQDCEEEIGFDLCGLCHAAREQPMLGSYLFKQKHLPSHRMHQVEPVPTFLHQVMDTHPELSVTTVINMVMSMAEEMAEDRGDQERSPVEVDDVDLADTNLFDEPQAAAPQEENATASDTGMRESPDSREEDGEGQGHEGEDVAAPGPLDLTSRLVETVLALAEAEQAVRSDPPALDSTGGASEVGGASGAPGAHSLGQIQAGQLDEEAVPVEGDGPHGSSGGSAGSASGGMGSGWVWVDGSGQRPGVGEEGSHRGRALMPESGLQTLSDEREELSGVTDSAAPRECDQEVGVPACARDVGDGCRSRVAQVESPPPGEKSMQSVSGEGAAKHAQEQPGSSFSPSFPSGTQAGVAVADGQQHMAGGESHQDSFAEGVSQPSGGQQNEGGRGRAFAEERYAAPDRQQFASCEPGLRRSDSYHQLMMASA